MMRVGVVGAGLIGRRRAEEAAHHDRSVCVAIADPDLAAASRLAHDVDARVFADWRDVVASSNIDIVCVATPNGFLAEIAIAALTSGKHVLLEKPMGRNVQEAYAIAAAASAAIRCVKVGFNHRYHPAIAKAHEMLDSGAIGRVINARVRYGHGGRPGYEHEWRGNRELAGGGELTDQGVHVADLLHWFVGIPATVYSATQTAVWPLGELEDNAFAILRYGSGAVASFHTSWTQWKNLFSLEIFGDHGSLTVEGLGRSYGEETLTIARRAMQGGAPEIERIVFDGADFSWRDEWADFIAGVEAGHEYLGTANDGIVAMQTLAALYRSASSGLPAAFSGEANERLGII